MHTVAHHNSYADTSLTLLAATGPRLWTGRVLSGLAVLFLLFDSTGKLLRVQPVMDGTIRLGYSPDIVFGLGVTLLMCVAAYLIPRTSVLGALLLTGYLGGAVATHVRVESPLFTHVLFPTYVAALLWSGLLLRDAQLRAFLPGAEDVMSQVTSQDGTTIAYARTGSGPASAPNMSMARSAAGRSAHRQNCLRGSRQVYGLHLRPARARTEW